MNTRRRTGPPGHAAETMTVSLEQLERTLSETAVRLPSDAVLVRATSRALQALSAGGDFATLTCETGSDGMRITGGRDALEVARVMRARAVRRGDIFWAAELGRHLRFRIVRTKPQQRRMGLLRSAARLANRGASIERSRA